MKYNYYEINWTKLQTIHFSLILFFLRQHIQSKFSSSENTLIKFHRKINRYQLCPKNSKVCDDLLYDMSTQALNRIGELALNSLLNQNF